MPIDTAHRFKIERRRNGVWIPEVVAYSEILAYTIMEELVSSSNAQADFRVVEFVGPVTF